MKDAKNQKSSKDGRQDVTLPSRTYQSLIAKMFNVARNFIPLRHSVIQPILHA